MHSSNFVRLTSHHMLCICRSSHIAENAINTILHQSVPGPTLMECHHRTTLIGTGAGTWPCHWHWHHSYCDTGSVFVCVTQLLDSRLLCRPPAPIFTALITLLANGWLVNLGCAVCKTAGSWNIYRILSERIVQFRCICSVYLSYSIN